MGFRYAKAMGNSLRFMKARICDFSSNKFTDEGAIDLVLSMKPSIVELNLSKNLLGNKSLFAL